MLVWYSPTAIHFGIVAHDRQPGTVHASVSDRDNIGNDDNVTIYLDTFNDRRRAFFFGVNPLGVQDDGVRSEGAGTAAGNLGGGNVDRNPDFIYQSKGMLTDSGYVVEVRIPFKSLRYPGGATAALGAQHRARCPPHRLPGHVDRRPPRQRELPHPVGRHRGTPRPEARRGDRDPALHHGRGRRRG